MKKKASVKTNYIYNLIYQIVLLIVPIVVTPYLSRVLGSDGSGQYSFAFSITTYFNVFASLGFSIYGQRLIARHQGNLEEQKKCFWECFFGRLISVFIVLIVYFLLILFNVYSQRYEILMLIMSIHVVAVLFDIAFYFQGNEMFSRIVSFNVLIKLLGIAGIFLLVKEQDDLWIYAVIQCLVVLFSNVAVWLFLPKDFFKIKLKELNPFKHIKPVIILFLPAIAVSIYTSFDKTMIGLITGNDSEIGNYEYAEKIVKSGLTILTALGTVMISHNAQKFSIGDDEGVVNSIYKSSSFIWLLGIPIMFGLICVADNLVPWYLGSSYDKANLLIKIMSPLVILIGFSNLFGVQFFVAKGEDKKYMVAILIGAATNFILNLGLIYFFKSCGAALATIFAEFLVTTIDIIFMKRFFSIKKFFSLSVKYFIAGIVMFIPCYYLGTILESSIINTFIIVGVGVFIYGIMVLILQDKFVIENIKSIMDRLKSLKNKNDRTELK